MKFVIFGLSVSSSWGNGHATLWRSLLNALAARGHTAIFYERDLSFYANARDGWKCPPEIQLHFYTSFDAVRREALRELAKAEVAILTSYCPEGATIADSILKSDAAIKIFFDLDTPVTLQTLRTGQEVHYLPRQGLADFDRVLSFTGGRALEELRLRLGAREPTALYGWVDPATHFPAAPLEEFRGALSYLGTYAADRQAALTNLFVQPAVRMTNERFVLAGAQYPESFPWRSNIFFLRHLAPAQHPAFFCSSRATLNVTRASMAEYGFCPSGRLFEAAACGAAILTDGWAGLEAFFRPGVEVARVNSADDVVEALHRPASQLRDIGEAARERVLRHHTAAHRAAELEEICIDTIAGRGKAAHAA